MTARRGSVGIPMNNETMFIEKLLLGHQFTQNEAVDEPAGGSVSGVSTPLLDKLRELDHQLCRSPRVQRLVSGEVRVVEVHIYIEQNRPVDLPALTNAVLGSRILAVFAEEVGVAEERSGDDHYADAGWEGPERDMGKVAPHRQVLGVVDVEGNE